MQAPNDVCTTLDGVLPSYQKPGRKTLGASTVKFFKRLTGLAGIGIFDAPLAPQQGAGGPEKGPESIYQRAHGMRWYA
jgi:hypothetical protein